MLPRWVRQDQPRVSAARQLTLEARLGPERLEQLVAAYRSGASTRELARRFGAGATAVKNVLRRSGVSLRPRGNAQSSPISTVEALGPPTPEIETTLQGLGEGIEEASFD